MRQAIQSTDPATTESRPVRWLKVLRLLLTVIFLAIAIWNALSGTVGL